MQMLPWGSSRGCCRDCWTFGKRRAAERARLVLNGIDCVIVLGTALYVWLRQVEFDVLSSDHALEMIAKWLEQIPMDEYGSASNIVEEETSLELTAAAESTRNLDWAVDVHPPLPEAVYGAEPPAECSRL